MTDRDRIDLLERAVADLQATMRRDFGYAPPKGADLIDFTSLDVLGLTAAYIKLLHAAGINSVERLERELASGKLPSPFHFPADLEFFRGRVKAWRDPAPGEGEER